MKKALNWSYLLVFALLVAGCDSSPTAPDTAGIDHSDVLVEAQRGTGSSSTDGSGSEEGSDGVEDERTHDQARGDGDATDRVQAAIQQAGDWLQRAQRLAGPNPEPHVARALNEAENLLAQARRAFDAGKYRQALNLARESGALSRRVISNLS